MSKGHQSQLLLRSWQGQSHVALQSRQPFISDSGNKIKVTKQTDTFKNRKFLVIWQTDPFFFSIFLLLFGPSYKNPERIPGNMVFQHGFITYEKVRTANIIKRKKENKANKLKRYLQSHTLVSEKSLAACGRFCMCTTFQKASPSQSHLEN